MREFSKVAAKHPELLHDRSDVFKSAGFILKEEHTAMVKELLASLKRIHHGEKDQSICIRYFSRCTGILRSLMKMD